MSSLELEVSSVVDKAIEGSVQFAVVSSSVLAISTRLSRFLFEVAAIALANARREPVKYESRSWNELSTNGSRR